MCPGTGPRRHVAHPKCCGESRTSNGLLQVAGEPFLRQLLPTSFVAFAVARCDLDANVRNRLPFIFSTRRMGTDNYTM